MRVVTLADPGSAISARFVPEAGMIGISLADGDVELLGQRRGLDTYVSAGKTMGIPILYPWANRLSANTYTAHGRTVSLSAQGAGVRFDPNGLPIHGLLAAYAGWQVTTETADTLVAELDFGERPELLVSFPFPHLLSVSISLADATLTIRTTVTPTSDIAVPLAFGFHPYLQLPGTPRAEFVIDTPALRHLAVDDRGIPNGTTTEQPGGSQVLGDKTFDDGYDQVVDGSVFAVSGGGRRLEVRFISGYPAAQIFAPPGEDLICFEPMAAPTDALVRGGYHSAHPDQPAVAEFSISVGTAQ